MTFIERCAAIEGVVVGESSFSDGLASETDEDDAVSTESMFLPRNTESIRVCVTTLFRTVMTV